MTLQHPCPGARRTNPFGSRTVNYSAFGLSAHNAYGDYVL